MTAIHFQAHVSDSGVVTLPPLPETFYGEDVTVKVDIGSKTKRESLLDEICGGWADDKRSTEEIIREIYEARTIGREREPL